MVLAHVMVSARLMVVAHVMVSWGRRSYGYGVILSYGVMVVGGIMLPLHGSHGLSSA